MQLITLILKHVHTTHSLAFFVNCKTSKTIENVLISYFAYVHIMYYFKNKGEVNKTTFLANQ